MRRINSRHGDKVIINNFNSKFVGITAKPTIAATEKLIGKNMARDDVARDAVSLP